MTLLELERRISTLRLASIATELARGAHRWQSGVRHVPHQPWFHRLHRTDDYEVWVLGWDHDQGIELHDHGGSAGALCVVEGQLVETYTDTWTRRPIRARRIGPGEAVAFEPEHVHDLVNPGPGVTTSVHVYSQPLTTMTYYGHGDGSSFLAPLRTVPADEEYPALA